MKLGSLIITLSVGILIAISILGEVQTEIATVTGTGGVFENTTAGTLLVIVPTVMVAGILGVAYFGKK